MTVLDRAGILKTLPHRPPILLVDRVVAWEQETYLHAQQTFRAENPIFEGHFPGHPVVPGVLTIEALAQSAALLVNLSLQKTAAETLFLFMGIDAARFRHSIGPDEKIDLKVKQLKRRGDVYQFAGTAYVKEQLRAETKLMAKLVMREPGNG
jgi:3-hydroxyacyl-[acyl-carrier-protein] dehydratase